MEAGKLRSETSKFALWVRASSAQYGRGNASLTVRERDVVRSAITLDGAPVGGHTTLVLQVQGATSDTLQVQITDKVTGRQVYNQRTTIRNGVLKVIGLE